MKNSISIKTRIISFDKIRITIISLIKGTLNPLKILTGKINFYYPINNKNKVIIQIPYFMSSRLPQSTINALGLAITSLYHKYISKDIIIEIRLNKIHYPYLDSYILAQYISLNGNSHNLTKIHKTLFSKLNLNNNSLVPVNNDITYLTNLLEQDIKGVKLQLSGRLTTQRSIPRKTVKSIHVGSLTNNNLDFSQYSSKNRIGAYTVKVWISRSNELGL